MNIIIIEDEKPAARLLQRKVEKLGFTVKQMLHSVEEAINWFSNNAQPDLIFLDIQLSDGLSFEIFEHVITSYSIHYTKLYDFMRKLIIVFFFFSERLKEKFF